MRVVYFSETDEPRIDDSSLSELEALAIASARGRARFCLHQDHEDTLQQMVIALRANAYIQPHRQLDKIKSYVVLRGEIKVGFFGEDGRIEEAISMASEGHDVPSIIRFPTEKWHTVAGVTEMAVYLEIVSGPYNPAKTEMAAWAPTENQTDTAQEFLRSWRGF